MRLLGLAFLVSLSACGSCKREEEAPPPVAVANDGGMRARAFRRPFDMHRRDAGIPLPPPGTMPRPSLSTGAPAAPIE